MTPAKTIIELLKTQISTLEKLDEEVSGFAVIYPPEGTPVKILMVGNASDEASFYKWLRDRLVESKESSYGGVRMGQGVR